MCSTGRLSSCVLARRTGPRLYRQRDSAGGYRERQALIWRAGPVPTGRTEGQARSALRSDADQARSRSGEEVAVVKTRVENRLGQIRKRKGVGASGPGGRVAGRRQAIHT